MTRHRSTHFKYIRGILLDALWRQRFVLALLLLVMFLVVGFDVLIPWPFKLLIDNVLGGVPLDTTGLQGILLHAFPLPETLGFFVVFLYFISMFSLSIVEYGESIIKKSIVRDLTASFSKSVFQNLETMSIGFYNKQQIGDYIYRLGYDVSAFGELIEEGLAPMVTSCVYLIVTITIMLFINTTLTFMSLAALPILAYGLHLFNSRIKKATSRSEILNSASFSFIEEALNHLKIIQAFSQQKQEYETFGKRIDKALAGEYKLHRLTFLLSMMIGALIAVSYSIVLLYGIHAVFTGVLTTGLLIVFIFYLDNLTTPVLSFVYAATAIHTTLAKISRMEEFFDPHLQTPVGDKKIKIIPGDDIHFQNITLLGDEGKPIVKNLTFTIPSGKCTVIFGGSGSGKTSVANLLLRFVDHPSRGHIRIGHRLLDDFDVTAIRDTVAYVPQDITLFDDTIKNNLTFGGTHYTAAQINRAAELAEADGFIRKLPGNYAFKVGQSGNYLSGGQRQRVMLARALLKKDSKILLFDETFSALDVKTRRKVLHNITDYAKDKTLIIISNIFDVITAADHVVVLNHGSLIYSGSPHRFRQETSLYNMIMNSEETLIETL